ncbi:hypothetical protein GCM10009092_24810 [Bowmanella denitrificans]|uniref:Uncharacterized protein n=1 Tax=Bowmanella denitrificans TaxID=366582 RepID=A0ABN0XAW5_9ALTE
MSKTDDMPSIQLEQEDREAYLHKRSKQPKDEKANTVEVAAPAGKSAAGRGLVFFVLLLALAALAGNGWLYQQLQLEKQHLQSASARIEDLEGKLSATGEEMGESTVALQAKLKAVTEKTDELWQQMDKLWASAWRKNQSEIKDLSTSLSALEKQQQGTLEKTRLLESDISLGTTRLAAIEEQFSKLQNSHDTLHTSLMKLSSAQPKFNSQLDELKGKLRDSQQHIQDLGLRITQLENLIQGPTAAVSPDTLSTSGG